MCIRDRSKARSWLEKPQTGTAANDVNIRTLVQYALSCANAADFSTCNRLFRERGKLNDAGKALLAATFTNLERPENAKILLNAMADHSEWSKQKSPIHYSDTFIAARALSSAVEVMPEADLVTTLRDICLLYTSPSPRDLSTSRMPSSA